MIKARKRFVLYAMLCVFLLLFVLLGIINGVNFTMASEDADRLTQMLSQQQGRFTDPASVIPEGQLPNLPGGNSRAFGPQGYAHPNGPWGGFFPGRLLGTDSPEIVFSLRYFTFAFDQDGAAEQVAWQISAVSQEEALAWARSLLGERETGWTAATYRYRIYEANEKTFVTVIDQGRELLPCYRILLISGVGLAAGLIISCAALMYIGKKLFQPLEEADRKQKRFIADAEKEFKVPLTIINANTEMMERENGETEQTQSINRQVKQMIGLVKNLSTVGVFDEKELTMLRCDLSALAQAAGDSLKSRFEEKGRSLTIRAEEPVTIVGDSEALNDLMDELLENALKFSLSRAEIRVGRENGHTVIIASNDTNLPDGSLDQIFDRFTRLDNAQGIPGAGLGLSHVKEIVQAHNGRAGARAVNGEFILRINL